MIELNLDGYTDLPPGKLASTVTYLEMTERPGWVDSVRPIDGLELRYVSDPDPEWYRTLFRAIGEEWLW